MGANLSKKTLVGSDVSDLFSLPSLRGTDAAREKISEKSDPKIFLGGGRCKNIFFRGPNGPQQMPSRAVP